MHLQQFGAEVVVHAPAKLNLFFEVLGRREDGYHEVETLVAPIALYDTLYFQGDTDGELRLTCQRVSGPWGADPTWLGDFPEGDQNLVVRAVNLLRRRTGVRRGGTLRLAKRIPTAAGLGGGSSDAAAALAAANAAWGLGWSWQELAQLGAELGSDVPLFFARGPAICRGRGERVEPVAAIGLLHFVVVRPPAGLSTAAVYGACRPAATAANLQPLVKALVEGRLEEAGRRLFNRLEPAAETLTPWIRRLRAEFDRTDCAGHQMSGSGTCYFGLCRHARHARRIARRLQARGIGVALAVRGCR
jgi:4-diphosphocytidyl-2-C-methyl-D-erythritol kinase